MRQELGYRLTPYEEVRDKILHYVPSVDSEDVQLRDAWGRVLTADLVCRELVPPFDSSAMDGYAVQAADLEAASEANPVTLPVEKTIAAGDPEGCQVGRGQAVRIMTGAPLPAGADTVIPHELTQFTERQVTFTQPPLPGKNIRRAGGDMKPGVEVLHSGQRLRGPQLSVAATLGFVELTVSRRPRVAILSPGKELVEPSERPAAGQIRNSNAYGLAGLITEAGGLPEVRPIIEDSPEALRKEIRTVLEGGADLMVSTGGVSAGDFDFVQAVVAEDGRPGFVFKTDMRPGKPQVFGLMEGVPLMGLPGNPAAALVSFVVFVRPALAKMLRQEPVLPPTFPVRFTKDFSYKSGRHFMLRARVEPDLESPAGGFRFGTAGDQDSSFLSSMADANAIILLPADRNQVRAGEVFPSQWI